MRSFPLVRAGKPTVLMCCVMILPLALFSLPPMSGVISAVFIYTLYPCLILIAGLWGGSLAMGAGVLAAAAALYVPFGAVGAGLSLVYLLPFTAAFVYVVEKRISFFKAGGVMAGILLVSQVACFVWLKSLAAEGDVYRAAGDGVAALVRQSAMCDEILQVLYQNGIVTIRSEMKSAAFAMSGEYYVLTDTGRNEMLLSIASLVEDAVSTLPGMIVSGSILYGVGGLGLSLYIGRISAQRRAFRYKREMEVREAVRARREAAKNGTPADGAPKVETAQAFRERLEKAEQETPDGFPDLKMPKLSEWYLPRGYGLKVGLLALGYLPMLFSAAQAVVAFGQMAVAVFSAVYMLQGMASLNFIQKKAGVRAPGRRATLIVVFIVFREIFQWLGVIDQIANFRALRPPLHQNTDDGEE